MALFNIKPLESSSSLTLNKDWLESIFARFDRIWVGFSGGVDSHVLLHSLVLSSPSFLRNRISAIHVHHGLSENADLWMKHCEAISDELGVCFESRKVLLDKKGSIEEAARIARYKVFSETLGDKDVLLLAHHLGDQAETVLFRLLRGSGGKGLSGMPAQRGLGKVTLLRPFLDCSKQSIEEYAEHHQLCWIHDESNNDRKFTRNFLRHEVVPVLQTRFSAVETNIASTAQRLAFDYSMLEKFAKQQLGIWKNAYGGLTLEEITLLSKEERLFWLRHYLQEFGVSFTQAQLDNLDNAISSAKDSQPEIGFSNGRLMRHQQALYVLPEEQDVQEGRLVLEKLFQRSFDSIKISLNKDETRLDDNLFSIKKRPLDAVLVMPSGQHRKLKKWLNDQKIPGWWRNHLPYIFNGNDLVAIGNLWCHPEYSGLHVEWEMSCLMPFPRDGR